MAYLSKDFVAKMDDLSKQSTPKMAYLSKVFATKMDDLSK
jgi:hypothetical protein